MHCIQAGSETHAMADFSRAADSVVTLDTCERCKLIHTPGHIKSVCSMSTQQYNINEQMHTLTSKVKNEINEC